MLKNIPNNLSPDLLRALSEMGHGDEIVIADGNYPAKTNHDYVIRYDATGVLEILDSILQLFPLDDYSPNQVFLMDIEKEDNYNPEIWEDYKKTLDKYDNDYSIKFLERQEFYNRSKKAFIIVATGEQRLYANLILKKGVVR